MSTEIVPFGKYKGQPIEVLQADRGYCDWLMGQDWLQTRFPQLRTVIINNFAAPDETPEHNALQARFLDDRIVMATVIAVNGSDKFPTENALQHRRQISVTFESSGADIEISAPHQGYVELSLSRKQSPLFFEKMINDMRRAARTDTERYEADRVNDLGVIAGYFRFVDILIELKPSMGDDFPAVMRQIKALRDGRSFFYKALLIGAYTGVGATLAQVRAMFAASDIKLFLVSEIEKIADAIEE